MEKQTKTTQMIDSNSAVAAELYLLGITEPSRKRSAQIMFRLARANGCPEIMETAKKMIDRYSKI